VIKKTVITEQLNTQLTLRFQVPVQSPMLSKASVASRTAVGAFTCVCPAVTHQRPFLSEMAVADSALKGVEIGMRANVHFQRILQPNKR
jgi:hypothetical protein